MQRRRYLALSGALFAGIAGCSEDSDELDDPGDTPSFDGENGDTPRDTEEPTQSGGSTPTDSPLSTNTPTETPTLESYSEITIESAELLTIERSYDDEVGAEVVITNGGDVIAPNFKIGVDWLDADDEYIATSDIYGEVLEAGETWIARTEAWLDVEEPERIEGVEATLTDESPFGEYDVYPEDIEVTQLSTRASDEEVVVRGVIKNNRDTSEFLEFGAKVYNGDGDVIGMDSGIEEVEGGDSWRFEASPDTYGRNGQVETGKVIPFI